MKSMINKMSDEQILEKMIKTAKEAGEAVMEIYQTKCLAEQKEDKSPVTEADIISEKIILKNLNEFGYGLLSEETEDDLSRLEAERVWIIDPLDGTKDFLQKTDEFSVMIALVEEGEPILGVVFGPAVDTLYYAQKGKGAFVKRKGETRPLRVSSISQINQVRFIASRNHFDEKEKQFIEKINLKEIIPMGSLGLKAGRIGEGSAELYLNASDKTWEWDSCSGHLILEEAGGKMTDLFGRKLTYNRQNPRNSNGLLASNGLIHAQITEQAKQFFNNV